MNWANERTNERAVYHSNGYVGPLWTEWMNEERIHRQMGWRGGFNAHVCAVNFAVRTRWVFNKSNNGACRWRHSKPMRHCACALTHTHYSIQLFNLLWWQVVGGGIEPSPSRYCALNEPRDWLLSLCVITTHWMLYDVHVASISLSYFVTPTGEGHCPDPMSLLVVKACSCWMLGRGIGTPSGGSTDVTRNGMITLTRICHRRGRKGVSALIVKRRSVFNACSGL